jgi:hypothetical protein
MEEVCFSATYVLNFGEQIRAVLACAEGKIIPKYPGRGCIIYQCELESDAVALITLKD